MATRLSSVLRDPVCPIPKELMYGMPFPQLPGRSLSGKMVSFPDDMLGKVTILAISFRQSAQIPAESWTVPAHFRYEDQDRVACFHVPMISNFFALMSGFLDSGMRAAVPDALHEHVVTFYGDRTPYLEALGIADRGACYLYVLDQDGRVRYHSTGLARQEGLEDMYAVVEDLLLRRVGERPASLSIAN